MKIKNYIFSFSTLYFFNLISSPVSVDEGGTSRTSSTAYRVLCGGTTTTTTQYLSTAGAAGQGLVSAGASVTPVWQNVLPGYIAGTGFAYAGTTSTLAASPDRTIFISTRVPASITSAATDNIAFGHNALNSIISNVQCIAIGSGALQLATGDRNIGIGYQAGKAISTGTDNVAIGLSALSLNVTGNYNVAVGSNACLKSTVSGLTAVGYLALEDNTSGTENVACGYTAGANLIGGSRNSAFGDTALNANTVGNDNVACGYQTLMSATGSSNVAIGQNSSAFFTSGSNNIFIGRLASQRDASDSNSIVIGGVTTSAYLFGVTGVTTSGGINVKVDDLTELGTISSSQRFKKNIEPVKEEIVEAMREIEVVQFNYIGDATKEIQFGMIAEDVEKIIPEIVVRDTKGEVVSIQYEKLVPLIIKQVQMDDLTELQNEVKNIEKQIISLINGKG